MLLSKGFSSVSSPGMALDLKKLPERKIDTKNIQTLKCETTEHFSHAAEVAESVYSYPKDQMEIYFLTALKYASRDIYVTYLESKPVGVSEVFYSKGVAGIFFVGTIESARGKGIGTRVTLAPLYDARSLDCEWAVLHSIEMGFGVYSKIGFEHLYDGRFVIWKRE